MNILHLNQSDISGGAAIAGYRLHEGLLAQGIDSRLLVGNVKTRSNLVAPVPRPSLWETRLLYSMTQEFGLNHLHLLSSFQILHHPFFQAADVLNFHNLHTGYFNYLTIPKLTQTKPAIFTLHDMWSFTGHCAYSYDCERWKTGCGSCPYPNSFPGITRDNTHLEWKLKDWLYNQSNLTIVAPSRWLAEQAKQSLLNRFPIHHIPYGIDINTYQPLDRELSRVSLGIPTNKKVIMFGVVDLKETRKGGDILAKALSLLPQSLKHETVLLVMGDGGESFGNAVGIEVINLGFVSNDRFKALAYSAADLFLLPTHADNLPVSLQESMSCGTPMVSFNVGGVPDLVRPGITGYLANLKDAEDFCNGIMQLLENDNLRAQMSQNCREIAIKEYPLELQAKRYIEIYQHILRQARGTYLK